MFDDETSDLIPIPSHLVNLTDRDPLLLTARKIDNRNGRKMIGDFPSYKSGGLIRWESQLESDACYVLEADPLVLRYRSQPETFHFRWGGARRKWTPDFEMFKTGEDRRILIEIKYKSETTQPEFKEYRARWEGLCKAQGFVFRLLTDEDIRAEPQLENLKKLFRYAQTDVSPDVADRLRDLVNSSAAPVCALELERNAPSHLGINLSVVYAALWHRVLDFDRTEVLSPQTVLRVNGGDR